MRASAQTLNLMVKRSIVNMEAKQEQKTENENKNVFIHFWIMIGYAWVTHDELIDIYESVFISVTCRIMYISTFMRF